MAAVAYVPTLSRNLLSTSKPVEQLGKPIVYYKTKAFGGVSGGGVALFQFLPRRGIGFRNKCKTDPESSGGVGVGEKMAEAMRIATTGQLKSYEAPLQVKEKRQAGSGSTGLTLQQRCWQLRPQREAGQRQICQKKRGSAARCTGAGAGAAVGITRLQTGNAGGAVESRGGATGGAVGSPGEDIESAVGSRKGDTGGAVGSRV